MADEAKPLFWGWNALKGIGSGWSGEEATGTKAEGLLNRAGEALNDSKSAGRLARMAAFLPNAAMWSTAQPFRLVRASYTRAPIMTVALGGLTGVLALAHGFSRPRSADTLPRGMTEGLMTDQQLNAVAQQGVMMTNPQMADVALAQMDPQYGQLMTAMQATSPQSPMPQVSMAGAQHGHMMSQQQIAEAMAAEAANANRG